MTISVIVCAHNEARYLPACLHSVLAQSRVPDELLVINNASTDETSAMASQIPHVQVVDEPRKGLVVARETGRRHASGDLLIFLDADCRAPLTWLERIERRFDRDAALVALSGPYRCGSTACCLYPVRRSRRTACTAVRTPTSLRSISRMWMWR